MYRFTSDLDLSHLKGGEVVEISIVPFNLLIRLEDPNNHINLCGKWRIRDSKGSTIDEGNLDKPKDSYRAHILLKKKIASWQIPNEALLSIIFEDGFVLDIIDDSDEYECCHISPDIYV